jgi:DNA polymerase
MPILIRDYETRSQLNLKFGAWRYSQHPSTAIWCCGYAVDDGPVELWLPGDPVPAAFIEAANNPEWLVAAFNDSFERLIEQHILGPRYGFPLVSIERHRCLQAAALSRALPGSLDGAASALKLAVQKDMVGRRTMLQMAKPRRPRKGEDPEAILWFDDPVRRQQLYAYCKQDVVTERELHRHVPFLDGAEQALWILDQAINDRGVHIDRPLLDAALRIAEQGRAEIDAELAKITGGEIDSVHQVGRLLAWLNAHGAKLKNIGKESLEKELTNGLREATRQVIRLRLDGAHAAANKLDTMRAWLNGDSRARGTLKFHGASTGRWSSYGIQLQNLKRPIEDIDKAIDAVALGSLEQLRQHYPRPISVVGDITRGLICAAPGHRLIAGDLSGIESRVLAWVSGQQSKLDMWAKFDRTGDPKDEPYYLIGKMSGMPEDKARPIGKTADLAFGYQGAVGAWRKLAPDDSASDEHIKQLQYRWHNAHPHTVLFWKTINEKAVKAVRTPGRMVKFQRPEWRHISFESDGSFLFMHLPSGRKLAYPFPSLRTDPERNTVSVVFMDTSLRGWSECRNGAGAYGGTWTENAVQAIARDIIAEAMVRLEAAGYRIVLHVHDEVVAEVPDGFGCAEEFLRILITPPTWATDLPLAAKVRNGQRFAKSNPKPIEPDPIEERIGESTTAPPPPPPHPEPESEEPEPELEPEQPAAEEPQVDNTYKTRTEESQRQNSDGHVHGDTGPKRGKTVAQWFYRNPPDQPNYLRVDKHITGDGKRNFYQHHWNGTQWIQGVKGTYAERKIPYRLPELRAALKADPDIEVQVSEGEKDCDTLVRLGYVATTNPGGALSWTDDLTAWLRILGVRRAAIHEDNDESGRERTAKLIAALGRFIKLRVVRYPDVPEGEDISWWMEEGKHSKEELDERIKTAKSDTLAPLPFIDIAKWDSEPVPEQEWTVVDKIPRRQPALFSGEGGTGKSMEGLHLAAAHVLGRDCWLTMPEQGPAIYIDAEDDDRVLHIRLAAITEHYGVGFTELKKNGLNLLSLAGKDAVMATVSRNGKIEPTAIYRQILEAAGDIKPVQIVIASSANVFSGSEIDRSQVQQFVGLLTSITILSNGSLVLCSHPSLTGISTGTGLSGTTQWHNAMRARFYMKGVKPENGAQPDNDLREIEFKKNQYGKISDSIVLRYQAGMYLPVPGASLDKLARETKAEEIFIELLRRLTAENRYVSDKKSPSYAPAVFSREDESKKAGIASADFAEAMRRLFAASKIWNEPCGRPSRPSYRIAVKSGG